MSIHKDIPVARRVQNSPKGLVRRSPMRIYGIFGLLLILALIAGFLLVANWNNQTIAPTQPAVQNNPVENNPQGAIAPSLLGHFAYAEAPLSSLKVVSIASDGYEIRLRATAAEKYTKMVAAAKADGIELLAISGFRTKKEQDQLFFDISKQRSQTPAQRALVSAPPGYSEHHTGYALDLGDRLNPSTNLSPDFDQTEAFKWLTLDKNAAKYGFELSFPKDNSQGVMYEPWHWRFVGDIDSLAVFNKK
jgi:zinc D-Ala-D-Ala carboxypeptidase